MTVTQVDYNDSRKPQYFFDASGVVCIGQAHRGVFNALMARCKERELA